MTKSKFLALLLTTIFIFTVFVSPVSAAESYKDYFSSYNEKELGDTFEIDATFLVSSNIVETFEGKSNVVMFTKVGDSAEWKFNVEKSGFYNLGLEYFVLESRGMDSELNIKIDGKNPFEESENITFYRWWKDSSDKWYQDGQGNEYSCEQVEIKEYHYQLAMDAEGVESEPFCFFLNEGVHTISIVVEEEPIAISKIVFEKLEQISDYKTVSKTYENESYSCYKGKDIVYQAEKTDRKNSSSITAKSDSVSASVTPNSPYKNLINYIGADNWSESNQSIVWKINAPEDGLYKLGFKFKQNGVVNGNVYRKLKIDGKVPFEEAKEVTFNYDTSWQFKELSDGSGSPYLLYLTKGEHTLELSVTIGAMSEFYSKLSEIVELLGDEYLKITMITGETPDANRDYDLFKQISGLEKTLNKCHGELIKLADDMQEISKGESTQYVASLRNMTRVLEQMSETKYLAHTYKRDYYTQYCNISSLLSHLKVDLS